MNKLITGSFLALLLVVFTAGCSKDHGTDVIAAAPTVSSTVPADTDSGVPINRKIIATFSEAMDSATTTTTTFTVTQGTTAVSGAVTCVGLVATFTPAANLAANTLCTATITTGAKNGAGTALASNYVWTFTTGANADTTAPTVSSTVPANAATGVAINVKPSAIFSKAMDPASITATTFTLKQGATPVSGALTYVGETATFTPAASLAASTLYTATITTGARDLAGNALASNYVWTFTTGATADTTAPTVSSTFPANAATSATINVKPSAIFSEVMDPATITTANFTLKKGATSVSGTVTYVGTTATFRPAARLIANTLYTATITTGARDLAGNALAGNFVWTFTTSDTTAPTVSSTFPANGAMGVAINVKPSAIFSKVMDPTTITTSNFTVMQGTTPVAGAVTFVGTTATFTPAANLATGTTYTATVTTGVKDLAGNALASNKVWTFTTGTAAAAGPAPVNLGTAGNYVILAKTGISTTGTTAIVGDLGLSPAAASYITGFGLTSPPTTFSTSAIVTGKVYAADYDPPTPDILTTAIGDMEIAFTDAAGRTLPDFTELGAGNISGMTLVPGLYKWGTGVSITSAGVTLTGGANDVWIFQIAQDLAVGNGAIVTLGGGAQAKNIFWQVSGQTTLGTTADFKGIILCQTLISLNTGAVMNGRALAQTAVTLNANAVTQPAP